MSRSRGAQLTIVFVLIVILILAGLIIYWYTSIRDETGPADRVEVSELTAEQVAVKNLIDSCLMDISLEGVELLRLQGGFIYLENISTIEYVSAPNHAIERDGIPRAVPGEGKSRMGMWSTGEYTRFPSSRFMEEQLERYINERIPQCVDGFREFSEKGWSVYAPAPRAYVGFGQAVSIGLYYPVTIRKEGEWKLDTFLYSIPVNLVRIQNLAQEIVVHEYYTSYLERHTKKWLSYYQGTDESSLPPFFASIADTECNGVSWSKEDVRVKVGSIIETLLPQVRFAGTQYEEIVTTNPMDAAAVRGFTEQFLLFDYRPLKVTHHFDPSLGWEFDILPSAGDMISPDKTVGKGIPFLPQICTFKYAFKYYLDFPVITVIEDPLSASIDLENRRFIEKEGFVFMFPMEVFICGNQNRECVGKPQYMVDLEEIVKNITDFGFLGDMQYCRNAPILLELDMKVLSGNDPVEGAQIQYQCGSTQPVCFLGKTSPDGMVTVGVPSCVNGKLSVHKSGYSQVEMVVSSTKAQRRDAKVELLLQKVVNVSVMKVDVRKYVRTAFETGSLSPKESVSGLRSQEKAFISVRELSIDGFLVYPLQNALTLSPGVYSMEIMLLGSRVDLPALPNGSIISGMIGSEQITHQFTIDREELDRYSMLELYVWGPNEGTELSWEELGARLIDERTGDIHANLIYASRVQGYDGTEPLCDEQYVKFVKILGLDQDPKLGPCEKATLYTISKEQYLNALAPRWIS